MFLKSFVKTVVCCPNNNRKLRSYERYNDISEPTRKLTLFGRSYMYRPTGYILSCRRTVTTDTSLREKAKITSLALCAKNMISDSTIGEKTMATNSVLHQRTVTTDTSFEKNMDYRCWQCQSELSLGQDIFCKQCGIIQKPQSGVSPDYFQLFAIPRSYEIQPDIVTNKFRKLQMMCHPDRYANNKAEEQQTAEELSSFVNKAYETLQNPMKRALYLLSLEGVHINEQSISSDPLFLNDVMEINEKVAGASASECLQLHQDNMMLLQKLRSCFREHFENEDFIKAKDIAIRMKYYYNLHEKLKDKKLHFGLND